MNELSLVSLRNSLASARFLLSAVILIVAAVALQPGTKALAKKYEKKPMAIRKPLSAFDISRLPSFQTGWKYSWGREQIEDIGTAEYMHIILNRKGLIPEPKQVELLVTYYNNPRDKVPHTPDVCSRQEGAIIRKLSTLILDVPALADKHSKIKCRLVIMDFETVSFADIYLFFVEGKFRHTREQVRWDLGKPGNSRTYFSKIEAAVVFPTGGDPSHAIQACKTMLAEALPILLSEHFPTDEQITAR